MKEDPHLFDFEPRATPNGGVHSWTGHRPFAYQLVSELQPSVIVELGTHYGESYFTFCHAVADRGLDCECHAVDTWQGEKHAGTYSDLVYRDVQRYSEQHYKEFSHLHRMMFDEALELFSDETIDILHIDGLHTYEAVKHDFETWLPKVRKGGIILFHDTAARHADFGVWRLWEELGKEYECFEFSHSWGLGVLRVPDGKESKPGVVSALLSADSPETRSRLEKHFRVAGEHLFYSAHVPRLEEQNRRLRKRAEKLKRRQALAWIVAGASALACIVSLAVVANS